MKRYYIAPPDDPNGNAGKWIGTDGTSFWLASPDEISSWQSGQVPGASPGATPRPSTTLGGVGGGGSMGGGGMSPALQAQLAAQQAMLDAQASGNREKFEEAKQQFEDAQRLQYMEMFGYNAYGGRPGAGGGASSSGAPAGSWTRGDNGESKTVAQMRSELGTAGWPNADKASDQEVVTQYEATTKTKMTPAGGAGGGGGSIGGGVQGPNTGLGRQIKDIYRAVEKKMGRVPGLLDAAAAAIATATPLTAEQAMAALRKGEQYFKQTGQEVPDEVLGQDFDKQFPHGQNPTLGAQNQDWTQKRMSGRDDQDDWRWQKDFDKQADQFNQGQYNTMARSILDASVNMTGPRDYAKYQQMLSGGRDVLSQMQGGTPQAGFGMSGNVEPRQVSDILEAMGMIRRPQQQEAVPGRRPLSNDEPLPAGMMRR